MPILHSLIDLLLLTITLLIYKDLKKDAKKDVVINGRFKQLD